MPTKEKRVELDYLQLFETEEDLENGSETTFLCFVNGGFYKNFGDEYHNKAIERSESFEETLADLGYWVEITSRSEIKGKKHNKYFDSDDGDLVTLLNKETYEAS